MQQFNSVRSHFSKFSGITRILSLSFLILFLSIQAGAQNFIVNNNGDTHATSPSTSPLDAGGNITLRSAMEAATAQAGPHIITFAGGITAINLTLGNMNVGSATSSNITVSGPGMNILTVSQTTAARMFTTTTQPNFNFTVQDITLNYAGPANIPGNLLNSFSGGGGAVLAGGTNAVTTLTNIKVTNWRNQSGNGGAVAVTFSTLSHNFTMTGCVFDNNMTGGGGGAVAYSGLGTVNISKCTFTNNSCGPVGLNIGGSGGALNLTGQAPGGNYTVTECTFVNNSCANVTSPGGAVMHVNGQLALNYNRFVGNTAAAGGSAVYQSGGDAAYVINATNNWWGHNTAPTAAEVSNGPVPVTPPNVSTWLQLKLSASPSTLCATTAPTTSLVTASFLSNSANTAIPVANLDALIGLPISYSAILGTLSGAQTTIQATGTATVTFTTNGTAGAASVNGVVDNVPNNDPTARASITVNILPNISAQPANQTTCAGSTTTFSVTAGGTPAPTYQWRKGTTNLSNGATGNGSTISGATTNTLTITNTALADAAADYNVVVTNSCGTVTSNNASLTVKALPVVTAPTVTQPTCTTPTGTIVVNATGASGTIEYSINNGGSYQASATFAGLAPSSTFNIVVRYTAAPNCPVAYASNPVAINAVPLPPTVNNPVVTTGTVGTAFSQTFTTTGGLAPITLATSSTLPTGLTFTAGVLSGTPTQAGTFPIVVTATDANGCVGTGSTYNLVISCQTITVTNPGVTTGTNGTPFSQTFTQTGALGGATFSVFSGTLPNGLTLSAAGVLSGTPSAPAGTYPIVVRVTDGNGCFGNGATYNLVISCQTITVTNPVVTTGQLSIPFSQTFTQTGGIGATTFALFSGSLPAGLTLSAAGILSGTPTTTGTFPIVVRATDANGCFGNGATYTLVITACPVNDQTVSASPASVCAGGASTITVGATQPGVNYTLRLDPANTFVAGPTAGNGPAINFPVGPLAATTTYNVLAETDKYSVYLNGGEAGFNIPQAAPLDVTNNFTIEGWIKPDGTGGFSRMFNKSQSYALGLSNGQSEICFTRHNSGDFTRPFAFVTGQWYHIACTYVSGTVEFFVDGVSVGTVGGVPGILTQTQGAQIGSESSFTHYFKGNIDNVRIWNSVRTQAEIAANQTAFLTSTGNPSLVASWWIIEGTGNAKDYSANAINATSLQGTWVVDAPVAPCSIVLTTKPTVSIIPDNTITLMSAAGTDAQILCIGSPITTITYNTTGATGATFSGLPGGITANWAANVVTISGTPPAAAATYNYTVTLTGGCGTVTATGSITVNPTPTVNSVPNQVVCNGASTAAITFTGAVPGTIYSWTNTQTSIGLAASGTGNIASFTATNAGTTPVVATVTVTPSTSSLPGAPVTQTFNYTGALQTWTVPAGVTSITVDVSGAQGMTNVNGDAFGGNGGRVQATLSVTPGEVLNINVGQGGISSATGGFNGGGDGGATTCTAATGGGGGGSSDINRSPYTLPSRLVVAGGGGGAGGARIAGCGPGSGGGGGGGWYGGGGGGGYDGAGGTGGTPSAGGTGGVAGFAGGGNGAAGSAGSGGAGGLTVANNQTASAAGTTGGAGGNTTGAAGASSTTGTWRGGAGGGGSSYTIAGATAITHTQDYRPGNGLISITYQGVTVCTGTPQTFTITVNPTPTVNAVASQTVCNGAPTTAVNFSGAVPGTVYNWTNNTPSIGLAGTGSGNIASFTATNATAAPVTATITVTPSYTNAGTTCTGTPITFTITVNPIPTVNAVANQTVCNGSPTTVINFSGAVTGTVYNWINNTPSIGLAASGSGDIGAFIGTNATNAPVTATITVTPSYTNAGTTCTGTPITFTITVNPSNTVAQVGPQTVCNGANTAAITFSSTATGGTVVYNWTGTNATIGLPASGSGNIASFTAINTGTTVVTDTIKVTAAYTNGGTTCNSPVMLFVITVNPTPTVNTVANQTVCNGAPTAAVNFTGAVAGTVYNWTNNTTSIGLAASGTGNIASFIGTNATAAPVTATVTVTPVFYNQSIQGSLGPGDLTMPNRLFRDGIPSTCANKAFPGTSGGSHFYDTYSFVNTTGQAQCVTITYNAKSTGDVFVAAYNGSYNPASHATNYLGDGGLSSIGGSVSTFSVTIAAGATLVVVALEANSAPCPLYVLSVSGVGLSCTGTPQTFTITVNPTPTVNAVANQTVCNGAPTAAVNFSGATTGTVYNWTNNTPSIGLAASGSGNIPSFTATNATAVAVTATITVTPSYTNGGTTCTGTPITFTITVNPSPTVNAVANQVVCNGGATAAVTFSGATAGTVFNWTNNTPSIGLAGSGTGNIASFTATNATNAPVVGTITVTPSYTNGGTTCTGTPITFTITVNPTPTVNAVANQVVCNGTATAAVNFTGFVPGTVYSWTNNTPSIGLAASGSGNIASFTATNATNAPVVATITVTPSYTNAGTTCTGTPITFTITVNPTPTVNAVPNQVVCNGAATAAVNFTGFVPGTVYNWTNNTPSIGLAGSGSGNIASFTATNATNAPVVATITVTPTYTNGGTTCTGTPTTFTITVNPTATVNAVPNQVVCNGTATAAVNFSSPTTGGTIVYNWTNNTPAIGLAASGTGNIASFTATNATNAPLVATITVTPTYTNGVSCVGTPITFTITVNPTATINPVANQVLCHGATSTAITFTSPTTGGTIVYNWTNNLTSIGLAASGTGNIPSFTAINITSAPVVATITVTPTYTNGSVSCVGTPITFTITVNPPPIINTVADQVVCNGSPTTAINFTSPSGGGTIVFSWTNNNTSIGLGASGTGNIPSFTATNATNAPVTATITVTMTFTNGGITCTSLQSTFTITVNPTPVVNQPADQVVCHGSPTAPVLFTGNVVGTICGTANENGSVTLTAPPGKFITGITFASYGTPNGSCGSFTIGACHAANSVAIVSGLAIGQNSVTIPATNGVFGDPCGGTPKRLYIEATYTDEIFSWTNNNTSIGLGASGTGTIPSFIAVNNGGAPDVAVITVTPSYTNPVTNNALTFNGSNRVNLSSSTTIPSGNSPYTIETWVKPNAITGANGIIGWGAWSNTNQVNAFRFNGPTQLINYWWSNDLAVNIPNVLDGNWHHVAATFNGTTRAIYFDGVLMGSDNPTGHNVTTTSNLTIAQTCPTCPGGEFLNGSLDELRIWNVGRTQAEIQANMNTRVAANSSALAAYYRFDEGTGSVTTDNTGRGNNGVLTNSPVWMVPSTAPLTDYITTTCTGSPKTFTITVNPTPIVNPVPNQFVCNGAPTNPVIFTGSVIPAPGLVYNWTNNNTSIGLAASGTGDIASFIAVNPGNAPATATITVTATYTNGGVSCTGPSITFTITVNPTPVVNPVANQVVCNGGLTAAVNFSSPTTGGTIVYDWSNSDPSIGLAANGSGNIPAFTATNFGNAPVVATITVIPTYTNGSVSCTGPAITFTITVNPTPTVNQPANQVLCNGSLTAPVNFTGAVAGTVFSWTNNNTSIGLAASGTGNIASFTATNVTNLVQTATITVTPTYTNGGVTCSGPAVTFTITVNPTPTVNTPANQTVCRGSTVTVNFTGTVAGTVYNWTNTNTAIGLGASGTGNLNFTATNATNAPITGSITVTPTYTNGGVTCSGTPVTFTITVNPIPTVNQVSNQVLCNGSATAAITFSGAVTGTVYNWTNSTPSIGLAAAGVGNIASFTATNATNAPVVATITVTPTYTNGGTTCTGATMSFTITVNPTPSVNAIANQVVCNGVATAAITITGPVAGTVFSWTNNNTSIGLGASGAGNIPSFVAVNNTSAPVVATITVTPSYTNGGVTCSGTAITFTITVNPTAVVNQPADQRLCNGANTTAITFTGLPPGSTYNWTNNTPSIGLAASGTGNIPSFTAINTTNAVVVATITVTPTAAGCGGVPVSFTITVNPTPTVTQPANQTVCAGSFTAPVVFSGATAGTVFTWTNNNTSIGLGASGTGNIPAFIAINATILFPVTATITVTPTYTAGGISCTGTPRTFTITVSPLPNIIIPLVPPRVCLTDTLVHLVALPAGGTWAGPGVTGNTFSATAAGLGVKTLTYTYTSPTGCTAIAHVNITVADCKERHNVFATAIRIYPNPSSGLFNIRFLSDVYKEFSVRVVDANGREYNTYHFTNLVYGSVIPMDLRRLASGTYWLQVYNASERAHFPFVIVR